MIVTGLVMCFCYRFAFLLASVALLGTHVSAGGVTCNATSANKGALGGSMDLSAAAICTVGTLLWSPGSGYTRHDQPQYGSVGKNIHL